MISKEMKEKAIAELIERAWSTRDRDLMDRALRVTYLMGQAEGIDLAVTKMHATLLVNPEKVE